MLKKLSQREILHHLSDTWSDTLRRIWIDALNGISSSVVLAQLVAEIERKNIEGALALLDINPDRFAPYERAILSAWDAGGAATIGAIPQIRDPDGARIVLSWGARNVPAEQYIRSYAASSVDNLVGEALDNARQTLSDGLSRGQNPTRTARRLIGVRNPRNKKFEGGVIGLTRSASETSDRLYVGLRSGQEDQLLRYLGISRRDLALPASELRRKLATSGYVRNRQFDGHVVRALREGAAVPQEASDRIVIAYANKSIVERAKALALTETNTAIAKAQSDAFEQQIASGRLDAQDVTKTWGRTISREPRQMHLAMVGVTVPFDQPFILPDGTQCMHPHDPNLPASHRVNCKCPMPEYGIDFTAQALRKYRARIGG